MSKIINSDDLLMAIKLIGGMGGVDEKQMSGVTEAMEMLIRVTPEVKIEEPEKKEEKSVMWKDVKMVGDVLIFSCGDCGEKIMTTKRIKAFLRCPYCGTRNKFSPSVVVDGGLIF